MEGFKQTIQALEDEKKILLRRLDEIDVKIRGLTAEEAKLKEKKSTASTSSDHKKRKYPLIRANSTTFKDPFFFISELYDVIEDEKLINATDSLIGDFFNHKLSENDLLEKMKQLFLNQPNLISALQTFLATPAAVSRARKNFHEASHIMSQVALRFGRDSQQYCEFMQILETEKKNQSEMHLLDSQLEELLKDERDLKDAVKKYLQLLRYSVEDE